MLYYGALALLTPLFIWVYWGVTFTLIIYALHPLKKGTTMTERVPRLIRYTTLDTPELLSTYDEEKNLICIDRERADFLPVMIRNRLEMTELPETMIIDDHMGLRFGPYENRA